METSTIVGLIMGLISILVGMGIKGAPLSALNNPAAFLIIICGTISCLFTGFPMENMKNIPNLFKKVINTKTLLSRYGNIDCIAAPCFGIELMIC